MPAFAAWPAVLRRPRWRNEGADCRFWVALCSSLNPPPTAADKALGQALDAGSTTMLAEIFLLRMEAIYRASEGSAPAGNSRFVPITVSRSSPRLLWLTQQSRDFKDADRPLRPESSAS
jgi:hypothetical protein